MKTIEFYEVGDRYDTEGRGSFKVIARFSNISHANQYSIKRGNYGRNAEVNLISIQVFDSLEEADNHKREELKQKALAKLTPEEKKVLGL